MHGGPGTGDHSGGCVGGGIQCEPDFLPSIIHGRNNTQPWDTPALGPPFRHTISLPFTILPRATNFKSQFPPRQLPNLDFKDKGEPFQLSPDQVLTVAFAFALPRYQTSQTGRW